MLGTTEAWHIVGGMAMDVNSNCSSSGVCLGKTVEAKLLGLHHFEAKDKGDFGRLCLKGISK